MARIRTVKPEFWESEDTAGLSPLAALTFVGMLNLADDEGRGRGNATMLYARLHSMRDGVSLKLVRGALDELAEAGIVQFYTANGDQSFYYITGFSKHQVINKKTASKLPPPPVASQATTVVLPVGKEGKGKEGKGEDSCAEPAKTPSAAPPPELAPLVLYASDGKLCSRWGDLYPAWKQAFPGVDIIAEVRKAHTWETANPSRVKKDRPRFLNTWLSKAQDQPRPPTQHTRTDENGRTKCLNCGGTGTVADVAIGGGIKHVPCRVCQRKGATG